VATQRCECGRPWSKCVYVTQRTDVLHPADLREMWPAAPGHLHGTRTNCANAGTDREAQLVRACRGQRMKRSWRLVAIDVAFALALGFGIWLSERGRGGGLGRREAPRCPSAPPPPPPTPPPPAIWRPKHPAEAMPRARLQEAHSFEALPELSAEVRSWPRLCDPARIRLELPAHGAPEGRRAYRDLRNGLSRLRSAGTRGEEAQRRPPALAS
jgi:hypothetical protein